MDEQQYTHDQAFEDFNVLEEATANLERAIDSFSLVLAGYFGDGCHTSFILASEEKFTSASNAAVFMLDSLKKILNDFYTAQDVLTPYVIKQKAP